MAAKTIIIYSSIDGQTKKICSYMNKAFIKSKQSVEIFSIDGLRNAVEKLQSSDKIIIASSIRYGKHHPFIIQLVQENFELLNSKITAFVSVNLVARKPEKSSPETNPYLVKFLNSIPWKPTICKVFAGKLDYKKYSFLDRIMIKLIMVMTKGPTNSKTEIEYTNWKDVVLFTKKLIEI